MKRTLIIGGGASGIAAAIAASECGDHVTVLERIRKPLKKLGVTGNGRGNLLNSGVPVYFGNEAFAHSVLAAMPYARVRAFLEQSGLTLTNEDERIYPAALLASVAVDALLSRAQRAGVRIQTSTRVTGVAYVDGVFDVAAEVNEYAPDSAKPNGKTKSGALIATHEEHFTAERVIVCAGGAAAPMHGTDGTAYGLLTAFGHSLNAPKPALCALVTQPKPPRELSGQRVRATLTLVEGTGEVIRRSQGEALFADDGISGIAAMQLARFVEPGCTLLLDVREAMLGADAASRNVEDWVSERAHAFESRPIAQLFTGAATPALSRALLRTAQVADTERTLSSLTKQEATRIASAINKLPFALSGTRGFENAQVTAGGISADEFDPATMESRLQKGLFAAGEMLDVDGDCGGYNLMFAFATGLLAGFGGRK